MGEKEKLPLNDIPFKITSTKTIESNIYLDKEAQRLAVEPKILNEVQTLIRLTARDMGIDFNVYPLNKALDYFSKKKLKKFKVDYIVLAGFLLKIPEKMLRSYPKKIINIHTSLLPKYGGRGMYGLRVHQAVLANKEKESGITIHFVNKNYDEGEIILLKSCPITSLETIESLEKKIQALEFDYFPKTIKSLILK